MPTLKSQNSAPGTRLATFGPLALSLVFHSACLGPVCETGDSLCLEKGSGSGAAGDRSTTALAFDGVDDALRTPVVPGGVDQERLTMELWFKSTASGTMLSEAFAEDVARKSLVLRAGDVCARFRDVGGAVEVCTANGLYADGRWHHAALVFDGSEGQLRLDVDGALAGQAGVVPSSGRIFQTRFVAGGEVTVGGGSNWFKGELDELRVWTVARSSAELAANRGQRLAPNLFGLRLYLPLEGAGQDVVAADATSSANYAALLNFESAVSPWRHPGAL